MSYLTNKKITATIIILTIILLGGLCCLKRKPLPSPETATKAEIASFISDRDFMRMPEAERHRYMKKLKDRGILPYMLEPQPPERRENFRRHMEMFKQERLRKFYTMSSSEQEKALQEAAKELRQRAASEGNHQNMPSCDSPSHRKDLEGQSPEDRARTVDFAKRLRKHMEHNSNEATP